MRWLLAVLLLLALAIGGAILFEQYPGYVYVEAGLWTVETSLAFLVVALIVVFLLLYALFRLLGLLVRGPRGWRRGSRGRRSERSRRELSRGLIEMAEGRWAQAEKYLTRHAGESNTPLLHYLAAARAAQQAGAYERRDGYLKAAIEANPEADIAVSLTQAELQLAHHQTEHALATLTRLRGLAPQHNYVLKLLARLYAEVEDWQSLAEVIPDLRRRRVLPRERIDAFERASALGRFEDHRRDETELRAIWDGLSRRMREDTDVIHAYAERLIAIGAHDVAEKRLRHALGRDWDERLAHSYGRTHASNTDQQLQQAEGWLKARARSPMLLLALGRLSVRKQLWGKARRYFESSIDAGPCAETYYALAQLLDELGEFGPAREQYHAGLAIAVEAEGTQPTPSGAETTTIQPPGPGTEMATQPAR